jgi:uracil-DNA glycosylase family 4
MEDFRSARRVRRALRQRLESLSRMGVEQMPRASQPLSAGDGSAVPSAAAVSDPLPTPVPTTAPAPPTPPASLIRDSAAEPLLTIDTLPMKKSPSQERVVSPLPASDKPAQLEALCQQVRSCQRCPQLVANRTQTVFGVGNPQARLCFFGEAPGADEDRLGEPFVGRAGHLLDKIIEACTLQRSDVYILNTVKCRPENNRNPEPEEIENCRPFFEQQLEIIQPEFICCLGLIAAKALLDTKLPLGKMRGRLHPWRFAQVLVTYHPAYLLRNPAAKRMVWEDMQFLMREMGIKV